VSGWQSGDDGVQLPVGNYLKTRGNYQSNYLAIVETSALNTFQ
jgi:hypothetical protein